MLSTLSALKKIKGPSVQGLIKWAKHVGLTSQAQQNLIFSFFLYKFIF